ncbi:MAG TPA: RAMP superfamily CRISPR-associated protein [Thermoanaerobaculia bacterium]|nr:RAMP superfamily CRISPR-associated protein [Thermoanaerobaculia bacterium]
MRDPEQYKEHGRNDPLSPEQRREHPYDFVSLPEQPAPGQAVGHDRFFADRLTGRLTLVYETLTPLHVGSGVLETAAQCGLAGGATPVRGIVRKLGQPVLPGSGWKGVVRARFEAITRSRLGQRSRGGRVESWKLPEELRPTGGGGGRPEVTFTDDRVTGALDPKMVSRGRDSDDEVRARLRDLSPAEAVFGAMGYRGRVHPSDGVVAGPAAGEPLPVPPLEGPAAHRLAKPGAAKRTSEGRVEISQVEGRKFYYDGPLLHSRARQGDEDWKPAQELIDSVPAGCSITIEIQVESLTEAELGALLVSAGWGEGAGIVRFGGFKPAGLGKVRLAEVTGEVHRGHSTSRWRRPPGEAVDPARAVDTSRREGLIDDGALAELHDVTTRLRP